MRVVVVYGRNWQKCYRREFGVSPCDPKSPSSTNRRGRFALCVGVIRPIRPCPSDVGLVNIWSISAGACPVEHGLASQQPLRCQLDCPTSYHQPSPIRLGGYRILPLGRGRHTFWFSVRRRVCEVWRHRSHPSYPPRPATHSSEAPFWPINGHTTGLLKTYRPPKLDRPVDPAL